jgi:hypothetical protein
MHPTYVPVSKVHGADTFTGVYAYLSTIKDDGLPSRRDKLVAIGINLIAELVSKWLEGEELVHETCIVAFHHNAKRYDE